MIQILHLRFPSCYSSLIRKNYNFKTILVQLNKFFFCFIIKDKKPVIFVLGKSLTTFGTDESPVHVKAGNFVFDAFFSRL